MDSVLSHMHADNPALNAVVYDYSEQAMAQAVEVDRQLAKGVAPRTLEGIPVTVKVNVDLEGTPTTNGMPVFANNIAPGNSPPRPTLKPLTNNRCAD